MKMRPGTQGVPLRRDGHYQASATFAQPITDRHTRETEKYTWLLHFTLHYHTAPQAVRIALLHQIKPSFVLTLKNTC
jgi:hypothetical protein